ncbi:MAG: hypothetical protein WCT50_04595 [Patescibacteria group bacterium]
MKNTLAEIARRLDQGQDKKLYSVSGNAEEYQISVLSERTGMVHSHISSMGGIILNLKGTFLASSDDMATKIVQTFLETEKDKLESEFYARLFEVTVGRKINEPVDSIHGKMPYFP